MQGSGGGGKVKWPSGDFLAKFGGLGYSRGIKQFIDNLPSMLQAELSSRGSFDPQAIRHQLDLQKQFGPQMYGQQLQALHTLDPLGQQSRSGLLNMANRYARSGQPLYGAINRYAMQPSAFEKHALADLQSGYALPPDFAKELQSQIRGAQVARGNTEGPSAISAESTFMGKNALDLYQQRMQNALQASQLQGGRLGVGLTGQQARGSQMNPLMSALSSVPGPIQQISQIQPVAADRGFAFMNPNAGYQGQQAVQNAFQSYLGMQAANMPQGGGSGMMGGLGSIIGAVAPILASVAFSDRRLKTDIHKVGKTPGGSNLYSFKYKPEAMPKLYGVMADEIKRRNPNAVIRHPSGYDMVDYSQVT